MKNDFYLVKNYIFLNIKPENLVINKLKKEN